MIENYMKMYPELTIKYNRNHINLGADKNLYKVVDLAEGKFIWLFGNDEVAENGIKEVIEFILRYKREWVGFITVGCKAYNKGILYNNTVNLNKPEIYETNREDVISGNFGNSGFISTQIFNNELLKSIIWNKALLTIGTNYPHIFWYSLIFMKYKYAKAYMINKLMVLSNLNNNFTVENEIKRMIGKVKLKKLLLSFSFSKKYKSLICKNINEVKFFLLRLTAMKSFNCFKFNSFKEVMRLFYCNFSLKDRIFFSSCFVFIYLMPSFILHSVLKLLFKLKFKNSFKEKWRSFNIQYI